MPRSRVRSFSLSLLFVFALFCVAVRSDLVYTYEGVEERIPLVQLWFEGYWKEVRKPMKRRLGLGVGVFRLFLQCVSLTESFDLVDRVPVVVAYEWNGYIEQGR